MARKKPRTSTDRDELPQLIQWYLRGLEGVISIEDLRVLLQPDVCWSRDGKTWVEGREAVSQQIKEWRSTVVDTTIKMQRMQEYDDGCVKVDFFVDTHVRDGDGNLTMVRLGVIAAYMVEDQKLHEILEYWQAVPPEARNYQ
ncbi:MAG: hypothetical protein APF80_13400 [Alphaproteobacteria bacterium BRH_c36]|nr:MAG: hypothetical protein APF80_13400 [Alphaproteobacteria bacterium BRH_c36]